MTLGTWMCWTTSRSCRKKVRCWRIRYDNAGPVVEGMIWSWPLMMHRFSMGSKVFGDGHVVGVVCRSVLGKVRHIGVTNFPATALEKALDHGTPIVSNQVLYPHVMVYLRTYG